MELQHRSNEDERPPVTAELSSERQSGVAVARTLGAKAAFGIGATLLGAGIAGALTWQAVGGAAALLAGAVDGA